MKARRVRQAILLAAAAALTVAPPTARAGVSDVATSSDLSRLSLHDSEGVVHGSRSWAGARAVVLFFVMPDCPVSQGYVPEMRRIQEAYASIGVKVYAVQSDIAASDADVRQHVREFAYGFPVLLDPQQTLVGHVGATTTPEAAVLMPTGEVRYRGRIDNRIVSLGTRRVTATSFELRDALDAVIAGRPVPVARTTAFGCVITRRT